MDDRRGTGNGERLAPEPVCSCFPRLKTVTLAREARYRRDPSQDSPEGPQSYTAVKVTSVGNLNEVAESQKSGRTWRISEPEHVGGLADAPSPLEYLLSGAVGCFAAVYAFYAAKADVMYDSFEVVARAVFDKRGHMMEDAPPAGFQHVELEITVASDAPAAELEAVKERAIRGCPGIATLRDPVAITSRQHVVPVAEELPACA